MTQTTTYSITPEELSEIISNAIVKAVEGMISGGFLQQTNTESILIDKRQAARLISVCTSTIDNAARRGDLTRHYVGKSVKFKREDVLFLVRKKVKDNETAQ